jgi:predicted transcriptional regulator
MANQKPLMLHRAELRVMKIIWEKGEATVREVKNAIAKGRDLPYTTVATMLQKLERKGFLTHEVKDRTYVYRPIVKWYEVSQGMLQDLIDRLFDGSSELLINTLFQSQNLSQQEIQRLKQMIADYTEEENNE